MTIGYKTVRTQEHVYDTIFCEWYFIHFPVFLCRNFGHVVYQSHNTCMSSNSYNMLINVSYSVMCFARRVMIFLSHTQTRSLGICFPPPSTLFPFLTPLLLSVSVCHPTRSFFITFCLVLFFCFWLLVLFSLCLVQVDSPVTFSLERGGLAEGWVERAGEGQRDGQEEGGEGGGGGEGERGGGDGDGGGGGGLEAGEGGGLAGKGAPLMVAS